MEIKFNIDKSERKNLAPKIGEISGNTVQYLGAPTFSYQIEGFMLNKDSVLIAETVDEKILAELANAGFPCEVSAEPNRLIVQISSDFLSERTLNRVRRIIENKGELFKSAFKTDSLEIQVTEKTVDFPWFTVEQDGDADAYCICISMLCEFAKNRNRINYKPDTSDNEKYAFRCFLIRIGMVGTEYKAVRKVLLRNLTGFSIQTWLRFLSRPWGEK
ncbi:MAG: hypothetical protein Q4D37_10245 [Oscillospiraceae bacterium]|nr:hypothetical protein [Oscillospiraceae bacterium]